MVDYWTNFAKDGNPNGKNGDTWKPYTAQQPMFMVLDAKTDDMELSMSATPAYKGSRFRR